MSQAASAANIMNQRMARSGNRNIQRLIFRWMHVIFGIPILGYIYDSPSNTQYYAFSIRYVFVPVLVLSGLWMWKGHVVRRLISKRTASGAASYANL